MICGTMVVKLSFPKLSILLLLPEDSVILRMFGIIFIEIAYIAAESKNIVMLFIPLMSSSLVFVLFKVPDIKTNNAKVIATET